MEITGLLAGILEELKTTNDILASALGELREFLHPETSQSDVESLQEQEIIPGIVYYVLSRPRRNNTGWIINYEYQVMGYFRNSIEPYKDWDITSKGFDTYTKAVDYMKTLEY